ncbi:MAG TPA: DUF2231 domain-containing protein [Frankiaceae bacterium]|nr:DUF2231 domain-containing protein [Frankiaceae bacterium]
MTTLTALPESVRGLPLHVLVVHAVVVLVPLSAIGALLSAVWPAVRRQFGSLAVVGAAVATVLVPIATGSGKSFARHLGAEELVRGHRTWASRMLPTMIVLLVAVLALVVVDILTRSAEVAAMDAVPARVGGGPAEAADSPVHRAAAPLTVVDRRVAAAMPAGLRSAAAAGRLRTVNGVLAVVVVVAALIALYVVLQTGESGARAVWGGR